MLERLKVYDEQTGDLVGYYREQGNLKEVPASGSPDEVYDLLMKTVGAEA